MLNSASNGAHYEGLAWDCKKETTLLRHNAKVQGGRVTVGAINWGFYGD